MKPFEQGEMVFRREGAKSKDRFNWVIAHQVVCDVCFPLDDAGGCSIIPWFGPQIIGFSELNQSCELEFNHSEL